MKTKSRGKPTHSSKASAKGTAAKRKGGASPHRGGGADDQLAMPDLPDMAPFDDESHCPRFRVLISRDPDTDPATIDELDTVQHELEQMLLHNMDRQRKLTDQISFVTTGELPSTSAAAANRKDKEHRPMPVFQTRSDAVDKKSKQGVKPSANGKLRESFVDTIQNVAVPSTDRLGRRRVFFWPQNHMPDKFWQFVSEYCQSIDDEDISVVQQLIKECSEDRLSKLMRVPGLGKHYSLRRCEEESSKSLTPTKKPLKRRASGLDEEDGVIQNGKDSKKSKMANGDDQFRLGPLTERLVQALVDEQHGMDLSGSSGGDAKDLPEMNGVSSSPNKTLIKSLNLGNMAALERRIKKELELQGLLDDDDESDEQTTANGAPPEDEVTAELRLRQKELRELSESNRAKLQSLLNKCRQRQERQAIEEQLEEAENEILQLFSKFYSLVPKRKPCNKKERDALSDALKTRQELIKKLENMK
uniref:Uncharacterized protein n=1 Tax=Plectus sambesii TaxID=2011161 RepID=A0A914VEE1_9BILA